MLNPAWGWTGDLQVAVARGSEQLDVCERERARESEREREKERKREREPPGRRGARQSAA